MIYINDRELLFEIIVSKGKGKLTKKAEKLLIQLAENVLPKLVKNLYNDPELCQDMKSHGLYKLFTVWKSFNHLKYDKCIPYYVEIFKRGTCESYNIMVYHSYKQEFGKIMVHFDDSFYNKNDYL